MRVHDEDQQTRQDAAALYDAIKAWADKYGFTFQEALETIAATITPKTEREDHESPR